MRKIFAIIPAGAILFSACISTSSEPEIVSTQLVASPEPIVVPASFDLTEGAALYETSCAPCHGLTGEGDGPSAAGFSCPMPAFVEGDPRASLIEWYNIVHDGLRTSDTCIMPPWKNQLSDSQIWNVTSFAASLRYDFSQIARGAELLPDPSETLVDVNFQAETSDTQFISDLANNTLPDYSLEAPLSPEDQQAVLVYLRSLVYGQPPAAIAQVETQPAETEEAPVPTISATNSQETLSLTGTVVNGTAGSSVPEALMVRLRVVALNAEGQPEEIFNQESPLDENFQFAFEGIPNNDQALAALETEHAGLRQLGPQLFVSDLAQGTSDLTFTIYETTEDPVGITFANVQILFDAVTAEGAALVLQSFQVNNPSDRIYLGEVTLPLPDGAFNPELQALGTTPTRFRQEQEGDEVIFYDTDPAFPGLSPQVVAVYDMSYEGEMVFEQSFPYEVGQFGVYVPQTRGLEIEGDQFVPVADQVLNNSVYVGVGRQSLAAGQQVSYRIFDGANAIAQLPPVEDEESNTLSSNALLILGVGVLLLVGGGMLMFYDLQKKRIAAGGGSKPALPRTQAGLVAAIAELDQDFEEGNLSEEDYLAQREDLKAALRRMIS
jgi:mono/diheme cytochrome c family protein